MNLYVNSRESCNFLIYLFYLKLRPEEKHELPHEVMTLLLRRVLVCIYFSRGMIANMSHNNTFATYYLSYGGVTLSSC